MNGIQSICSSSSCWLTLCDVRFQVISRTKTPAEIIAEYERIQREREERRLQQRTNPRVCVLLFSTFIVGLHCIAKRTASATEAAACSVV